MVLIRGLGEAGCRPTSEKRQAGGRPEVADDKSYGQGGKAVRKTSPEPPSDWERVC